MSRYNFWETEITYLKKVGPKRAEVLKAEVGIRTFGDLLHYFPFKYTDKSHISKIHELRGEPRPVTLVGKITKIKLSGAKRKRLEATFTDGSGIIQLIWFKGINWIRESLKVGEEIAIFGQPKYFKGGIQLSHPEIEKKKANEEMAHTLKIIPSYNSTDKLNKAGLDSRGFRTLLYSLLEIGGKDIRENLTPEVVKKYNLMGRKEAIYNVHFPTKNIHLHHALRRLKFEEFFFFQLMLAQQKIVSQPKNISHPFEKVGDLFNQFYKEFIPFELTNAQKRVVKEIRHDTRRRYQMNRLVQGDVGSGKTMVAFMTCLLALDNGFQCGLMAPTEILAGQHYNSFKNMGMYWASK